MTSEPMSEPVVHRDEERLMLTIGVEIRAPIEVVWELWSDPRRLEQWWGPPGYPATFTAFDLAPGARCAYHMTGPDGARYHGLWDVVAVDPPHRLEVDDCFGDDAGRPRTDLPTSRFVVTLADAGGGVTRMVIESRFASLEAMEETLRMGALEGMLAAMAQIPALL